VCTVMVVKLQVRQEVTSRNAFDEVLFFLKPRHFSHLSQRLLESGTDE
jgi:hypothetical protein